MLVNSVYNMADQIFIGWGVGTLGNSAVNAVFPMILIATSVVLLFGDGGATPLVDYAIESTKHPEPYMYAIQSTVHDLTGHEPQWAREYRKDFL